MSRCILAFDYGLNHIGIAVGQTVTGTASALGSVKARQGAPDWPGIENYIKQWQPDRLIVGMPLNMDGSEQPLTRRVKKFARALEGRFGLAVDFADERLSTVDAKQQLFEQHGFRGLKNKGDVDAKSAAVILETWFAGQDNLS